MERVKGMEKVTRVLSFSARSLRRDLIGARSEIEWRGGSDGTYRRINEARDRTMPRITWPSSGSCRVGVQVGCDICDIRVIALE